MDVETVIRKLNKYKQKKMQVDQELQEIRGLWASLKEMRSQLTDHLRDSLHKIQGEKFLRLNDFLYPAAKYPEMRGTRIDRDFLYLFYDSLGQPHVIHPNQVIVLHMVKITEDLDDFVEYTEENLSFNLDELVERAENWFVDVKNPELLIRVQEKGESLLVVPNFIYLKNGRKTHSRMKINNVYVFCRKESTRRLFEIRDLILQLGKVL